MVYGASRSLNANGCQGSRSLSADGLGGLQVLKRGWFAGLEIDPQLEMAYKRSLSTNILQGEDSNLILVTLSAMSFKPLEEGGSLNLSMDSKQKLPDQYKSF